MGPNYQETSPLHRIYNYFSIIISYFGFVDYTFVILIFLQISFVLILFLLFCLSLYLTDLWIGHDQLELQGLDGDETVDTTLARSASPDYRSASSMDRTRNYGVLAYSGTTLLRFSDNVLIQSKLHV